MGAQQAKNLPFNLLFLHINRNKLSIWQKYQDKNQNITGSHPNGKSICSSNLYMFYQKVVNVQVFPSQMIVSP